MFGKHIVRYAQCFMMSLLLMAFGGRAALGAKAQSRDLVLELTADTPWVVAPDQPEAVARALEDVKSDWYKVLGHVPTILAEAPASWKGPVVYLGLGGARLKDLVKEPFPGAESFVLRVQRDAAGRLALLAAGADLRGTIYAAYALSEEILGVDPWYFWTDHEPEARRSIAVPASFEKRFGPPTFKYRGWFINDEDLLSGFAPDPLRENTIAPEMWDHIYETLLRLRGNMIVPGTFVFPDERAQELASRRGLVLNMHHILTVGLNTFRWPKDVPFSLDKHPEIMERYWQSCIDAYKDREVVWTVGYRGKHDQPFWTYEPEVKTPQARGALISKAIAKQVEMIQKAQPGAPMIHNLWYEGMELLREGYLKIPPEVTVVWPDDGTGVVHDKGNVRSGQGVYYHTAMLGGGQNQLSEMVNPGRIYTELGRFARADATQYCLINVSDIRPIPLSTDCAMRLAWDAKPYLNRGDLDNMKNFLADWCRRQYGSAMAEETARLYAMYFDIPYQRDNRRRGENWLHFLLGQLDREAAPLIRNGKPLDDKIAKDLNELQRFPDKGRPYIAKFTAEGLPYVARLAAQAETLAPRIPKTRQTFYKGHLLTQARIHLHSLEMLEEYAKALDSYAAGKKGVAAAHADRALKAADDLFAALHGAEYGMWAGWYRGEGFVGLDASRDRLRALAAELRGQEPPPLRAQRGYDDLYRYQMPFQKNFPLLYPVGMPKRPGKTNE